jgi:conjugal transfer/entry exclusion protein
VSNESKANIAGAKKKLTDATTKAVTASSSADAAKAHNELLSIAVAELIQLREIQAQQLELLSSFFARFEGTSKIHDPSKVKK